MKPQGSTHYQECQMEPHTVKSVKLSNCYSKPHPPTFINEVLFLLFLLLLLLLLHSFYLRLLIAKSGITA